MSTRKKTKFNKNNGYKDFTFSIPKLNNEVYNSIVHAKDNVKENTLGEKIDTPIK